MGKFNRKKFACLLLEIVLIFSTLLFSLSPSAFAQSVTPTQVSLTLKPTESSNFTLKVQTGAQPIPKIDVVFAIDMTGSMGDEISVVKSKAISIMNDIRSTVADSDFGVVTFSDYSGRYVYPGYNNTYGGGADTPWKVNIQPTDNTSAVSSAINSITLGGGSDEPEDYTRVLYECISLDWRPLTKKIVILIGDAPTHDLTFAGYNYGGDPGRDGIAQTSDDLVFKDVVDQLRQGGIVVLAVQGSAGASQKTRAEATFKGMSIGFADVAGTGGLYFQLSSADQIPNAVYQMVSTTVSSIKHLTLNVPRQYADWVSYSPSEYTDVGPDTEKTFSVTIRPPANASGSASIPIQCLGDGTLVGLCIVNVTVLANDIYPKSNRVAMVPDNWAWAGSDSDGGGLYVGTDWPNNDSFIFSNVTVADIENGGIADPLTAFDTVVLQATRFNFGAAWNNIIFSSRIQNFVSNGGKLIIYTSEIDSSTDENKYAFSHFIYPFEIDSPGATGSKDGDITNYENDTLSSTNPADESYVNITAIMSDTDAVGDMTVMVSPNSHWYIDLFGINMRNVGGPAHAYAFYGAGLIIFNGFDVDDTTPMRNAKFGPIYAPSNANGSSAIEMLWWRELSAQKLGPSANVNGLTLDPYTAVNPVNTTHVITATVRNITSNSPIAGIQVNFTIISGPNANLTGYATTNASGQTTFNWTSLTAGIDTLQAMIPSSNPYGSPINTTATKLWVTPGNLSVSITPSNWTMNVGETKEFTAVPNGGSFNYTGYQWFINGSAQNNQILQTYLFKPNSAGYFLLTVKVTDNTNTTAQSDNATVTVLANVNGTNPTPSPTPTTGSGSSSSDSSSSDNTSTSDTTPTPTEKPTPTPTPTPPDQYPTPVFLFNLGWVEIAIITVMAIVLSSIIVVTFKWFK